MTTLEEENISPAELIEKSKGIIDELLAITHPLVEQIPVGKSTFLRVLETTHRRAYHTLAAIHRLAADNILSSPAWILSRSLIEDSVSIEYMLATDKEEKAKRFKNFYYVQAREDNKFMKRQGISDLPQVKESVAEIDSEYKKIKQDYIREDKQVMRSWDNIDVDGMLRAIKKIKPDKFPTDQVGGIARSYLIGNRKTHFNPIDLTIYFDEKAIKSDYEYSMMGSLTIAIAMYVRLTARYVDEISLNAGKNLYTDIGLRANELLNKLDEK